MLHHVLKGFLSCLLAKVYIDGDLSAKKRLQTAGNIAEYAAASDGDASYDTQIAGNTIAVKNSARGDHGLV
jgi:hypothetical protein